MDPGTVVAIVTVAYYGAVEAWTAFRDALDYPTGAEDIAVKLELERFRLQTWAKNVGLADGTLHQSLFPVHTLIQDRLERLKSLFKDAETVKEHYGLSTANDGQFEPEKAKKLISEITQSLGDGTMQSISSQKERKSVDSSVLKRARWGLTSKSRFEKLITKLQSYIDKLNELLTESQYRSSSDDWKRVNIVIVGNVRDQDSLDLIRNAVQQDALNGPTRSLVERKAINISTLTTSNHARTRTRFITHLRDNESEGYFLFEKKEYDRDISVQNKQLLKARVDRLVLLLSSNKSDEFRTLEAFGCCSDPATFCWWLVFRYPLIQNPTLPLDSQKVQPMSLLSLFTSRYKPPLEHRFQLAWKLASTLAELFSSSWLHKGIRSDNVIFLHAFDQHDREEVQSHADIANPYVTGFDYSRQDSEAQTIDKDRKLKDILPAIYRHPDYQGEAAAGYKMHYDIYSFGLVLSEIAWWVPLSSFLDAAPFPLDADSAPGRVNLSSEMSHFHRDEALELQRRIGARLEKELAFRVGSAYCEIVRWCLHFNSPSDATESDWHPALELYNHVVVPLQGGAGAMRVE